MSGNANFYLGNIAEQSFWQMITYSNFPHAEIGRILNPGACGNT